jgi:hypothetical protein
MLPVHDIYLHAEIQDSVANTQAMGLDRRAESMSGCRPWTATAPRTVLSRGFEALKASRPSAQV